MICPNPARVGILRRGGTQNAKEPPMPADARAARFPEDPTRRRFLAAAGGAAALLATPAWAQRRAAASPAGFLGWTEVRGGVHATTHFASGGNVLAVAGRDGTLLVDTKYPVFARQLVRDAQTLTQSSVSWVVNTHHHGDHVAGNLAFHSPSGRGLPVMAHRNAVPRVRAQVERLRAGVTGGARQLASVPEEYRADMQADLDHYLADDARTADDAWTPGTALADGTTGLDLGGRWVEFHAMGLEAHTDNDVLVVLPNENVVHTGDLVFHRLFPFMDPDGGGTATGWMDALRGIIDRCDADTVVVPGHGEITDVRGVRAQLAHFENLFEAIGAEIDKGTPLEDVRPMTWPFMDGLGFERIRERGNEFIYNEIMSGRE
jgi:cyclase